ncbi:MAG: aminopeptidase P family protein [Ruminococcaceae bacterium]|jgi:Xaa-Pro aminopeptidase|nr:aminopeptidase P family protein [Oscillospiraceae bacterium]
MSFLKSRIETILKQLPDGIDAVLITSGVHRQYFTGFQSSAGTLLMVKNAGAYFIIDFRYYEKARAVIRDCEVILQEKLSAQLSELIKRHSIRNIVIESEYMTVSELSRFRELLPDASFISDKQIDDAIRRMRMIKSPEELASIRAAQEITDGAFQHICGYIHPGMTEKEIACELLDYTNRHGSERPSFEFIVVSGANSSMPHGVPTGKAVEPGDFITMDFGCVVDGYCSDMTRTVAVKAVTDKQKLIYDTVLKAQLAAIQAIKAGIPCKDVDTAARNIIADAGYGDCFGHSTGHSVGLEIHEKPAFSISDKTICEPGMVITVEPGIYIEGQFGVRIEDMALITESGCSLLTGSPKQLMVV